MSVATPAISTRPKIRHRREVDDDTVTTTFVWSCAICRIDQSPVFATYDEAVRDAVRHAGTQAHYCEQQYITALANLTHT